MESETVQGFISAQEAAERLGYHKNHVYRLLREGKLAGKRFGGGWVISAESVELVRARQSDSGRVEW